MGSLGGEGQEHPRVHILGWKYYGGLISNSWLSDHQLVLVFMHILGSFNTCHCTYKVRPSGKGKLLEDVSHMK